MEWTLEQLVDAQIDYRLAGHYTALLCVVTQVRDLEEARVDVQPLISFDFKISQAILRISTESRLLYSTLQVFNANKKFSASSLSSKGHL